MTMNSSGPISLGGTTAGQSIEIENGGPGTAQISLNDTAVRTLAGVPSGTIIMPTNFYGKSNTVILNLTIASSTQNYDVYANASASPLYVAGKTQVTVTINPGIAVGSSSTGSYAMLVPSSFNPADTVTIVNNGYIVGAGGSGGSGGSSNAFPGTGSGNPGTGGGNALYVNRPTTVTNNGTVGAGGGGGGGGSGLGTANPRNSDVGGGGGGGGAGYSVGGGGAGGPARNIPGPAGSPGSTTSGGSGGPGPGNPYIGLPAGPGGPGGGLGSGGSPGAPTPQASGGNGGGSANYITGNPFVTWPSTGTRLGGVA